LPALFGSADGSSLASQRLYRRGTVAILAAAVAAAVLGALGGAVEAAWCAVAAALAFLASLVVQVELARRRPEEGWYGGRAVAESVKSLAWQYAVAGGPYGKENEDAEKELVADLRCILADAEVSLAQGEMTGSQVTDGMRGLREQSLDARRDAYLRGRIRDQRTWYGSKATFNRKRRVLWLYVIVVAQVAGGAGAVLAAAGVLGFDALGVAAAVVAAGIAWVQYAGYGTLEAAYSVAAHELGFAEDEIRGVASEGEWAGAVSDAEQAISREHRLWRASRGVRAHPS
jgi:hypothetical protein